MNQLVKEIHVELRGVYVSLSIVDVWALIQIENTPL